MPASAMVVPQTSSEPIGMQVTISPTLAAVLRSRRQDAAAAFLPSITHIERFKKDIAEDVALFIRLNLDAYVDYLANLFETGNRVWWDLFLGEKVHQCFDAQMTPEEARARRGRVIENDRVSLLNTLEADLSLEDYQLLSITMDRLRATSTHRAQPCRVLLVGDCLFAELASFLLGPLLEEDIEAQLTFITSRNPLELHRILKQNIAENGSSYFDLVFFSPFSYAFQPEYGNLNLVRSATLSDKALDEIVASTLKATRTTMKVLGDLLEAPIIVHNSAAIRRHDGKWKEKLKCKLTASVRSRGREKANRQMPDVIAAANEQAAERKFHLLDEMEVFNFEPETSLGSYIYYSVYQHPTRFGLPLAQMYNDAIFARMRLSPRKLLVSDLDNTLWKGEIGEGAVTQHLDRQAVLRSLRERGMLLAIASKNDPAKVHLDGALLTDDDFVGREIHWDPKTVSLKRLASKMNLKTKHFIFLDDRADERALANDLMPEIQTLDPEDPRTWKRLTWAAELMPEGDGIDRTLQYKQRAKRNSTLGGDEEVVGGLDRAELFRNLQMKATLRLATSSELKRVTELINRTNQFNMCGSRTTLKEMQSWLSSPEYKILIIEAQDRFGALGVVSVAVTHQMTDRLQISMFVLSCRVFGYGLETVMLNHIRQTATAAGLPVAGLFVKTPDNQPGQNCYRDHGFAWDEKSWWITAESGPAPAIPAWLTVDNRVA